MMLEGIDEYFENEYTFEKLRIEFPTSDIIR